MRTTGLLFILGAVLLFVPYTALTIIFDYPDVLRLDAGEILTRFHAGGTPLILTWWAFAMVGLPLLGAYTLLGQHLENKVGYVRMATTIGVIGLVVQMVGLLRWTFVVPTLAVEYVNGNEAAQAASRAAFLTIHQYGGVALGEHMGQLFTIAWTILMATAMHRTGMMPRWMTGLAYGSSAIYLCAQLELFATVIPGLPVWDLAGFLGSTLWLVWLIALGMRLFKIESAHSRFLSNALTLSVLSGLYAIPQLRWCFGSSCVQ